MVEIDSRHCSPNFLTHDSFYATLNSAPNLFFIDVDIGEIEISANLEATIKDQLEELENSIIIQCKSLSNTMIYVKEPNKKPIILDLNTDKDLLDEDEFTKKISNKDNFSASVYGPMCNLAMAMSAAAAAACAARQPQVLAESGLPQIKYQNNLKFFFTILFSPLDPNDAQSPNGSTVVSVSANSPLPADFQQGGSCSPKDFLDGANTPRSNKGSANGATTLSCAVCGDVSSGWCFYQIMNF